MTTQQIAARAAAAAADRAASVKIDALAAHQRACQAARDARRNIIALALEGCTRLSISMALAAYDARQDDALEAEAALTTAVDDYHDALGARAAAREAAVVKAARPSPEERPCPDCGAPLTAGRCGECLSRAEPTGWEI